jgi:hypothetical protein
MIIYRYHDNWPTYNKKLPKKASPSSNYALNFAIENEEKGDFR